MELRTVNDAPAAATGLPALPPLPLTLADALARVDRLFGIDAILREESHDIVVPYYENVEPGYRRVHSAEGCMHMALNPDGRFDPDGYYTQARTVEAEMRAIGAQRVMEIGSGFGFNAVWLAGRHPQVAFEGRDLMDRHVRQSNKAAATLPNLHFTQGSFEPLDAPPESLDLVYAVECLCYARDLDLVLGSILRALRPGGRLVIYDGFRHRDLAGAPPDLAVATRLMEITMAVTRGFPAVADWQAAMRRVRMAPLRHEDLTPQTFATFRRLQGIALKFFDGGWKTKIASTFASPYLLRNAVAGLVGPFVIEAADRTTSYGLIVAEKPG